MNFDDCGEFGNLDSSNYQLENSTKSKDRKVSLDGI